ncbi:MAG: hypothetical protein KatS3mg113_0990 [Planctomycetaceae bacterium]|nr:MAG: hypothetical protein KatS3mg113_0990 [Planctomycetaceae bacterium]
MQWLAAVCIRRPVFATMLIAALMVSGFVAYPQLGVDRFPSLDLPTVMVRTAYPGAAAEEIETEVTQILEDAVATVAGIEELRSISSEGSSLLLVTFNLNRDLDAAVQDVRDAVGSVLNRLPRDVDPPVIRKQDTDSSPIMSLAVSGQRDERELYYYADKYVKNVIESTPGVAQVLIAGASDRAVQVQIDARRLAAYGLTILDVRDALARQNVVLPEGRVDAGYRELMLRTEGRLPTIEAFADLVVATQRGVPIRLGDLGQVIDGTKEQRTLARLDGRPAVVLQVQRQSGANTVATIRGVKDRLPRCRELLPQDLEVTIIQDQSRYIEAALHEIQNHLISGSLLATLVVLIFMKSWRSTLIAAVAIPTSIIATFACMYALGFTLNNVTMLALVLMVGVVIDDAIVVLENVFRFLEEKHCTPFQAALEGTREIGLAVLATTISLVIVFLPVSFLQSVTGRMLYQFGVTATAAILLSMLVSFTLTPMMCSRLLRREEQQSLQGPASRQGFYRYLERGYLHLLRGCLRARYVVLLLCLGVIVSNVWFYDLVKQDYIPTNVDESEFEVSVTAREGTSLSSMNELMQEIERRLQQIPGIEHVLCTVGTRGLGGVNRGELYVRLVDIERRTWSWGRQWHALWQGDPLAAFRGNFSQREKMQQIRGLLSDLSDCRIAVRNLTSLRQGAPVDLDISITGPDLRALVNFTDKLRQRVSQLPGIVDVDTTLKFEKPEWRVRIDRERAAAMGVFVREIADTLRIGVGGDDRVSRYRDAAVDDAYDVELRLVALDRGDPEAISQLYVRVADRGGPSSGRAVPEVGGGNYRRLTRLDNLIHFEYDESASRIDRLDRQRMVALRANLAPGYALSDRLEAIHQEIASLGLPPGFRARAMGRAKELERTLREFRWTLVLSIVFMYIVLAAQYEHFVHPFTILMSLPLTVPFGLFSLWWGQETLNLYSALGILVLFGVVKKAAILQIDHTNYLRTLGLGRDEAVLQANRDRLRPILMTTLSFVAGLLPLLFATGPGAEERRSIAVIAVGGQTLSLLLTLVAIPVIYTCLDDLGLWLRNVLGWSSFEKSQSIEPNFSSTSPTSERHKAREFVPMS